MSGFDLAAAEKLLRSDFAEWVLDLNLSVEDVVENGVTLRMAFSDRLCRQGGIVSGQAFMALADTSMVLAVVASQGGFRPLTTVDQSCHFLKPLSNADCLAVARVVRAGRSMAFARVDLNSAADGKPVAVAQGAFALL